MPEIQVLVRDHDLARHVTAQAAEAGVAIGDGADTALVVCDPAGLATRSPAALGPPAVLVAREVDESLWTLAGDAGVDQIVALPDGAPMLAARIRALAPATGSGHVVRVVGVRGGCGATSIAVGVAQALRDGQPVVVVDGDTGGPGVEVALGISAQPGVRWPDLTDIRGRLPAHTLLDRLPDRDGLRILSHRASAPLAGAGLAAAWPAVTGSLTAGDCDVVADVPRHALPLTDGTSRDVLVMPLDVAGLVCARQLVRDGQLSHDPVVAVRHVGGPVQLGAAQAAFDGLDVVPVPHCRGLVGAADFGDLADAVTRGSFARACRAIVAGLAGRRR